MEKYDVGLTEEERLELQSIFKDFQDDSINSYDEYEKNDSNLKIISIRRQRDKSYIKAGITCFIASVGLGVIGLPARIPMVTVLGCFSGMSLGYFSFRLNDILMYFSIKYKLKKVANKFHVKLDMFLGEKEEDNVCRYINLSGEPIDDDLKNRIEEELRTEFAKSLTKGSISFKNVSTDNLSDVFAPIGGLEGIKDLLYKEKKKEVEEERCLSDEFLSDIAEQLSFLEDSEEFNRELQMYLDEYPFTENDYQQLTSFISSIKNETVEESMRIK